MNSRTTASSGTDPRRTAPDADAPGGTTPGEAVREAAAGFAREDTPRIVSSGLNGPLDPPFVAEPGCDILPPETAENPQRRPASKSRQIPMLAAPVMPRAQAGLVGRLLAAGPRPVGDMVALETPPRRASRC